MTAQDVVALWQSTHGKRVWGPNLFVAKKWVALHPERVLRGVIAELDATGPAVAVLNRCEQNFMHASCVKSETQQCLSDMDSWYRVLMETEQ